MAERIHSLGISTVTGIPDSTLKLFCEHVQTSALFSHSVCANEGAAAGIAIGSYLATGKPACVYLQNSGLGNLVNPYTSLAHREVYGIPMLLVIGWRGDGIGPDEPQHKFMGKITLPLLDVLEIQHEILNHDITEQELDEVFQKASAVLKSGDTFALVVQRGTFEEHPGTHYQNAYSLTQGAAVGAFLKKTDPKDIIVSTTGKISRELYEKISSMPERRGQAFLTVGGMGFASSIAMGIAKEFPEKRIYCLDGDGAVLMHMGSLAISGSCGLGNFVHICLNNQAYESVGGMPTGVFQSKYSDIASACGYKKTWFANTEESFVTALEGAGEMSGPVFIEAMLSLSARKDLGRPKESAKENKHLFQTYHWEDTRE